MGISVYLLTACLCFTFGFFMLIVDVFNTDGIRCVDFFVFTYKEVNEEENNRD